MAISKYPSIVHMPEIPKPYPSVLDFLATRFPSIARPIWESRIISGKILTEQQTPVGLDTPYTPRGRLYYFREVDEEPSIPFTENIIFRNDDLLVACKPHFLPVIPAGPYVDECLLNRLKKRTGNHDLSPINRIDRETAGLVLFSMNKNTRGLYHQLFMNRRVKKTYIAVTLYPGISGEDRGRESNTTENLETGNMALGNYGIVTDGITNHIVEDRLIPGEPWFRMKSVDGKPNALTNISMVGARKNKALFKLSPITGKKHQLRLHLSSLGFPILNDRCYPKLLPKKELDFTAPLQLLAKTIQFYDPISSRKVTYESERRLDW